MKENKNADLAIAILDSISCILIGIASFLFIAAGPFKVYFLCFLIGGFLFLIGNELKLVFNKKGNKKLSILGIILMIITIILEMYDIINTIIF